MHFINDSRVQLVRGFYNESLTASLAKRMRPALFVMIDCDLYVSALAALEWLCESRLLVQGTLV
eukprot:3926101-Prymnesium_polylepis.1